MDKLIVILCIALSGCMYQSVNLSDIEAASKACGGLNQISELSAAFDGQESVICFNREKYGLESRRVR
jgi:hypothetical protein